MLWLNIDKGAGVWKLHRDSCRFCKPVESRSKGVNRMKRHGGWFQVMSHQSAYDFFQTDHKYNEYWQLCKACNPK